MATRASCGPKMLPLGGLLSEAHLHPGTELTPTLAPFSILHEPSTQISKWKLYSASVVVASHALGRLGLTRLLKCSFQETVDDRIELKQVKYTTPLNRPPATTGTARYKKEWWPIFCMSYSPGAVSKALPSPAAMRLNEPAKLLCPEARLISSALSFHYESILLCISGHSAAALICQDSDSILMTS